jgi:cytochrome P450
MGAVQNALLVALVVLPVYYLACIYRNYLVARKLGIPIVIVPVDNINPLSYLFSGTFHRLLTRLGFPNVLRHGHLAWAFREKARPFVEWDCGAFVQVTPAANWISLVDPVGAQQMYQAERRGDIARPYDAIKMLGVFGPNISTVSGAQYQRMKKVTATSFNESTNRTVWAESLRQGGAMVRSWLAAGEDGVRTTADATQQVALNIMLAAGFGKRYDFVTTESSDNTGGDTMDFRKAIEIIIHNAILIVGIGPENLPKLGKLSASMHTMAKAVSAFKGYMGDTIDQGYKEGQEMEGRGNLLGALVRALHEDKHLSEEEVYGNCFVFLFGGHDVSFLVPCRQYPRGP